MIGHTRRARGAGHPEAGEARRRVQRYTRVSLGYSVLTEPVYGDRLPRWKYQLVAGSADREITEGRCISRMRIILCMGYYPVPFSPRRFFHSAPLTSPIRLRRSRSSRESSVASPKHGAQVSGEGSVGGVARVFSSDETEGDDGPNAFGANDIHALGDYIFVIIADGPRLLVASTSTAKPFERPFEPAREPRHGVQLLDAARVPLHPDVSSARLINTSTATLGSPTLWHRRASLLCV